MLVTLPKGAEARFELGCLLSCDHCDQLLVPSWGAGGQRQYTFLCGCRRDSVDAELVERLVRDRVEAESVLLVTGVAEGELGQVFQRLFAAIRVRTAADDLVFVWRL
ncbi:hypothetical protein ABT369_26375 [Dactylosporangium sp. NPDC000244]|uniref:hypothetical protein n=1 Tax=Dactylosporangium sp. NPDC000244 TaxID=3154365 RepID=UPI00332727E6